MTANNQDGASGEALAAAREITAPAYDTTGRAQRLALIIDSHFAPLRARAAMAEELNNAIKEIPTIAADLVEEMLENEAGLTDPKERAALFFVDLREKLDAKLAATKGTKP